MERNTTIILVIIAILIILGAGIWYWMSSTEAPMQSSTNTTGDNSTPATDNNGNPTTQNPGSTSDNAQAKGTLYVALTDAAADMKNVTAVNMTIDKVEAYNKVNGWIT